MDIFDIATNAVEIVARRLARGAAEPADGSSDPSPDGQLESMIRQVAGVWPHVGPLFQRLEEQPDSPARQTVLAAAIAELAGQNSGFGDALKNVTEAAVAQVSQDDPDVSDSSITDSGDRSATITAGRDFRMSRSIFALGSVNNSRRTRINTGIGAMALVLLLGGGVATYQAVKPEKEAGQPSIDQIVSGINEGNDPATPGDPAPPGTSRESVEPLATMSSDTSVA